MVQGRLYRNIALATAAAAASYGWAMPTGTASVAANSSPTAALRASSEGLLATLNATASRDRDGSIVRYTWTLGDGSASQSTSTPTLRYQYRSPGVYTAQVTVTDNRGARATARRTVRVDQTGLPTNGRLWYVATDGSDAAARPGTVAAPFATLSYAIQRAQSGDTVVVRGGTYAITGEVGVDKQLAIIAQPGERPVFDGSIAAPAAVVDGTLRRFAYTTIAAGRGEGMFLADLPEATFSGGRPTGLAASRGWRCVTGAGTPSESYVSPGAATSANPSGCPAGSPARVVTGFWPDQVWVRGIALTQVSDRALVRPGTFWVPRSAASDSAATPTSMYLSAADAADMSQVRVSQSRRTFLRLEASGIRLDGLTIVRHSPNWGSPTIVTKPGLRDLQLRNLRIKDVGGVALKLAGTSTPGGAGLLTRVAVDRVQIINPGWMGIVAVYVDQLSVTGSQILSANTAREFDADPQAGAIKLGRVDDSRILGNEIVNTVGHGIWYDQSNYRAVVAGNRITDGTHAAVFFEISHGLVVADNLLRRRPVQTDLEGHSVVRIAGSSGVRVVNNTIVNGSVGLGVFLDPRSGRFRYTDPATGRVVMRYCAEHPQRYGRSTTYTRDCRSALPSDLDYARSGAYGAVNRTPGMNWMPQVTTVVNNVFANQNSMWSGGWTPCNGRTAVCVRAYLDATTTPLSTVFPRSTVMNGNVYTVASGALPTLADVRATRSAPAALGSFRASSLTAMRAGFGSAYYGRLSVERTGRVGTGYVTAAGGATAKLRSIQGQAAAVPADAEVNEFVSAGSRRYGSQLG